MYAVTVEFTVEPDKAHDFKEAVKQQALNSLEQEEACKRFDVCFNDKQPETIFLYELYDDENSFQQHLVTEHFKSFDNRVGPWITNKNVQCWTLEAL